MIQKTKNKIISAVSLKAIIMILCNALVFLMFFTVFALAYEGEEAIDTSTIDQELDDGASHGDGLFDKIFNKLGRVSSGDSNEPEIYDSEIRIHENVNEGAFYNIARVNVIDKTLGKLYAVDIADSSVKTINEISVRVNKCWAPTAKTLVKEGRALVEISEAKNKVITRLFKGWIYAHSPASSQIVHPKYDVSLAYCFNSASTQKGAEEPKQESQESAATKQ